MSSLYDSNGSSLIHSAIDNKNISGFKILIELGVIESNLNKKDNFSMTPLHIASINYNKEIYDLLMIFNPIKDLVDSYGFTALDYINDNEELSDEEKEDIKIRYFK